MKEVTENVHESQYSARVSQRLNITHYHWLIVFYQVEIWKFIYSINNALGRIGIPLTDFKVQCYHGASNMVGADTKVATCINEIKSRVHLTHCYGHAFQLAAGDTIKAIKND